MNIIENKFCCGCSACVSACPVKMLKMGQDADGFYKSVIDRKKCIDCGKCVKICPFNNPQKTNDPNPKCYAFAGDKNCEANHATAGGFGWIAKDFIKRGGKVVGAAWGKDFRVEHIIVDNEKDLSKLYRSKYAQSFMGDVYEKTKAELEKETLVLFSGTPCQIAGLYAYLGKNYNNLWSIDLFCHHAPSNKQLQRYLAEKYGDGLKSFDFCAAALDNQHNYNTYTYTYMNGRTGSDDFRQDLWGKAFLSDINKGAHCENCVFKGLPRMGDLTLGDFHGLRLADADFMGTKPAVAVPNNAKGEKLIEIIKDAAVLFKEKSWDLIKSIQSSFNPTIKNPASDRFFGLARTNTITKSLEIAQSGKWDIGIVGGITNANTGGGITYYALYSLLRDMGKTCLMIPSPMSSNFKPDMAMSAWRINPYPAWDFAAAFQNKNDMNQLNDKCDVFMVGSDQMFHPNVASWWDYYMEMEWVADEKKKVSVSTSFGRDVYETENLQRITDFNNNISRFDMLSVREKSGIKLLKEQFGIKNAIFQPDPVFLCDRSYFDDLAEKGSALTDSIFCYILDDNEEKQKIVANVAKKIPNATILSFGDAVDFDKGYIKKDGVPYIEDWIAGIKNSRFVIADSFHGICFAIIYRKPFVAIVNDGRGACRFRFFADDLGLGDRLVNSFDEYTQIKTLLQLDYAPIIEKLDRIKSDGMCWLKTATLPAPPGKKYPKWIIHLMCCFISNSNRRRRFRRKYSK